MMMNVTIDKYNISYNGYCASICIDGQNIVHDRVKCGNKKELINYAVNAIERYNKRHGIEWGFVE